VRRREMVQKLEVKLVCPDPGHGYLVTSKV
jgi:hypothetical protein